VAIEVVSKSRGMDELITPAFRWIEIIMVNDISGTLANFSSKLQFDDLPEDVVHETKRIILDVMGCALGSLDLEKGRIAVEFAQKIGGRAEASILGTIKKVSCPHAAFANGELMHSSDYCPILPPLEVSSFVLPASLALAEVRGSSGKAFITATATGCEIASRIGLSLGSHRAKSGGAPLSSWGLGCNTFGAAVAAAKIMGLETDAMSDALGLAGYFAPVPSHQKFTFSSHAGSQKYGPAGWTAQAGVTAALLAEMGERGDRQVLDGDYGFWAMNGSQACNWELMTRNLGTDWNIRQVKYKRFPCCGVYQSPLGAFTQLVSENDLKPEEIEDVLVKSDALHEMVTEINDHIDAQNSLFYNIAVAAYGIPISTSWQTRSVMENPDIRQFMKKVRFEPYAKAAEASYQELVVDRKAYINRRPSYVEVTARGKVFTQEAEYAQWLSIETPGFRATDDDLAKKFKLNAASLLKSAKLETTIDMILNLEEVTDINTLITSLIH